MVNELVSGLSWLQSNEISDNSELVPRLGLSLISILHLLKACNC